MFAKPIFVLKLHFHDSQFQIIEKCLQGQRFMPPAQIEWAEIAVHDGSSCRLEDETRSGFGVWNYYTKYHGTCTLVGTYRLNRSPVSFEFVGRTRNRAKQLTLPRRKITCLKPTAIRPALLAIRERAQQQGHTHAKLYNKSWTSNPQLLFFTIIHVYTYISHTASKPIFLEQRNKNINLLYRTTLYSDQGKG